jgi:hypothetical protein
MRTVLRSALITAVVAGTLVTAAPAHARTVCVTLSNGAQDCYDNGGDRMSPETGGGESGNVALPPPPPARPAPDPAHAPLNVPAVPAGVPKPAAVPAPNAPVPVVVAPPPVDVPEAPVPAPNQAAVAFAPARNSVIAGWPAEVPPAEAAPSETPSVASLASASATPSPSDSSTTAEPSSTHPAQVEQAADRNDSPAAFFGVLAVMVLIVGITWWQMKATKARRAEYDAYEASK